MYPERILRMPASPALTNDEERKTTSPYWRSVVTAGGITYHLLEEDVELFPGVRLFLMSGHTPAVAVLLLEAENGNYLFPNDACSCRLNYGPPTRPTTILYDSLGYEKSVRAPAQARAGIPGQADFFA